MSAPDELTPARELPVADALELLATGELTVEGRLIDASNATLYCSVTCDGVDAACVYKPVSGERPLWDFPDGTLAEREVAAYEVSAATGWLIVPADASTATGRSGRAWCSSGSTSTTTSTWSACCAAARRRALRRIAVFDAVINNADRKGGHLLPTPTGHLYGVDHGVTFNVEPKLRTLLWQWAGDDLTDEATDCLRELRADLAGDLGERLHELLTVREVRRLGRRIDVLLESGRHPEPARDRPAIPWPPM